MKCAEMNEKKNEVKAKNEQKSQKKNVVRYVTVSQKSKS